MHPKDAAGIANSVDPNETDQNNTSKNIQVIA